MADTVQSIRMTAVSMFRGLIQKHPDAVLPMLPYSIPVLEGRLYVDEHGDRQEQTEEIRLELLKVCLWCVPMMYDASLAAFCSA